MPLAACTPGIWENSRFLFVHGNDERLKRLTPTLMKCSASLLTAGRGDEALTLIGTHSPCVLVSTASPEDMTGFELCRRAIEMDADLLVILIGEAHNEPVYRRAMEAGVSRYLTFEEAESGLVAIIDECRAATCARHRHLGRLQGADHRETILGHLPWGVALIDGSGTLCCANPAFIRFAGLEGDGPFQDAAAILARISGSGSSYAGSLLEAVGAGREWSGEICRRGEEGTLSFFSLSVVTCIPREGGQQELLLLVRDVTRECEREKRLLVKLNAAGDLLDLFRSPDGSCKPLGDEISRTMHASGSGPLRESLASLHQRLLACRLETEALTHVFRVIDATAEPERSGFSLSALLKSLAASPGWTHPLGIELPDYLPDRCLGDPLLLGRMLACLITNAVSGRDPEAVRLTVDLKEKHPDRVRLDFTVAFPDAATPFNRFEWLSEHLEKRRIPSQAGLSLAATLAESLGGTVWVKSEAGRGRSFCCTVPLALPVPDGEETSDSPNPPELSPRPAESTSAAGFAGLANVRVLLADDNVVDQLTTRRLLEKRGALVVCVSNGREAVDEFDCGTYDLVLMDILMPEMDGFEATRLIKEKERLTGSLTPVVALSSYSLKAVSDKCSAVGMDGFLSKPVSGEALFALLASLQTGNGEFTESAMGELPLLDMEETIANLGNDPGLYREVMLLFNEKAPVVHADLLAALRGMDRVRVEQLAHKLKGMSSNIGAARYADLNREIQERAHEAERPETEQWIDRLIAEFGQLRMVLADLVRQ